MVQFNEAPQKVQLTNSELQEFWIYLTNCNNKGFTGINYFGNHNAEREYYMAWHLREISSRVLNKMMSNYRKNDNAKLTLAITEPEQKTLSHMFKRVECTPYMLQLQPRFLAKLVPVHLKKW